MVGQALQSQAMLSHGARVPAALGSVGDRSSSRGQPRAVVAASQPQALRQLSSRHAFAIEKCQTASPAASKLAARAASVYVAAAAAKDPPTVSDTKAAFLKAYPVPIPAIYNTVIQELLVLQHLTRYTKSYQYDPVFALGFVTVYDQLMDGYPSADEREPIFVAYIKALNEDPAKYRADAEKLEKWASGLSSADDLVQFATRDGDVEKELKNVAERASSGKGEFHYSRFFAVGLFRMLELAKASDPAVLQQLCEALGVNKMSVNRDLDVYRGLLSKLTQAKELLKDFLKREKSKKAERQEKAAA